MPLTHSLKDGKTVYKYKIPSEKNIQNTVNNIYLLFTNYVNTISKYLPATIQVSDANADINTLMDVIVKVDKRNIHATIFHDIEKSCEYRVIALYCYWIVKLHPFSIIFNISPEHKGLNGNPYNPCQSAINESFAIYLFERIYYCLNKKSKSKFLKLSQKYLKELKYTLRYRDINKASFIMLLEPHTDLICPLD